MKDTFESIFLPIMLGNQPLQKHNQTKAFQITLTVVLFSTYKLLTANEFFRQLIKLKTFKLNLNKKMFTAYLYNRLYS